MHPAGDRRQLGRYELIARIGEGGMAEVQLARLRGAMGFEKLVVVKLVHEHLASQKSFVEMLMQEARLAALVKHPNVVDIYDLGESEGRYFVAMEYLAGEPMLALLRAGRDGKRLDPLSTGRLIAEVAEGLTAAHQLRTMAGEPMPLVHHDISLGNIMVLYTGQAKLVDFGVAKAGDVAQDDKDRIKGKFGYMAPEKLRGEGGDARSDLFSLGVVLWEALTLRRLFRADTDLEAIAQVLEDPIAPPSQINGDVPKAFDAICAKALERTVDRRYQTAAEMAHDIESVLKDASYSGKYEVIAAYMQKTFADHICARSQLIKEASTLHGPSQQLVSAAYDSDARSEKSDPAMTRPTLAPTLAPLAAALPAPAAPLTPLAPIPPASAAAEAVRGRLVKKGQAKVAGASGTGAGTGNDGDGDEATTQQPLIDADSPEAGGARQTGAMAVARAASSIGGSIGSPMRRDVAAAMAAAAESTATEVIHESMLRASTAPGAPSMTSVTSVKATQPMAFVAAPLSRASGTAAETDDGSDDVSVAVAESSAAPSAASSAASSTASSTAANPASDAAKASASAAPAEASAMAPASLAAESASSANRTEEIATILEKADAPADAAAKAAASSSEVRSAAAPTSSAAKDAAPAPASAAASAAGSPAAPASSPAAAAGSPAAEGAATSASPTSSPSAAATTTATATAATATAAGATEPTPAVAAAADSAPADRKPLPGQANPTVTEVTVPAPPVLPSVTAAATVQTPTVMWADQEPSVTELSPQWPSGEVSLTEVSAPRSAAKSLIPSIPKILPAKSRQFSEESEATEVSASPIVLGDEASAEGPRNSAKAASPSAALRASGREQRVDNGGPPPGLSELLAMVKPGTASMSPSKPPLGNVLSEVSGDLSASGTLPGTDSSAGAAHGAAAVENGDPAGAGWGWNGAGAELSAEELGHARRLAALRRKTRWMVGGGVGLIALVAIVALATGGSGNSGTGALGVRGAGAGRLNGSGGSGGSGATEPGSATASAAAAPGDPQLAGNEPTGELPTGDDSTFPGATRPDQIALAPEATVPAAPPETEPSGGASKPAEPSEPSEPVAPIGAATKLAAPAAPGTRDDFPGEVAEPRPVAKPAKAGAAPERRDDDRDDRKKPELDVEATFKAGQSEFLRGDSKAALATFRKVLTASPSYAPAWRGSALALERLGQKPAAAKALRRYLKLAPNAGDAAQIKARLERLE